MKIISIVAAVVAVFTIGLSNAYGQPSLSTTSTMIAQGQALDDRGYTVYVIPHEATDPKIRTGDHQNVVVFDRRAPQGNLLLFIGGANSFENSYQHPLFEVALRAGYRAIALDWKYEPPATSVCPQSDDDLCYAKFRETKVFGTQAMPELNVTSSESIVNRASALLVFLNSKHPNEGWDKYLTGRSPNWSRIALSGHSQASGMAAFLAKRERVARVVLFSSPKDHFPRPPRLAQWLSEPSATPAEFWYGAYHAKEGDAEWMGLAYQALGLPPSHIRVFSLEPFPTEKPGGDPYHFSTVGGSCSPRSPNGTYAYQNDWAFFLGSGAMTN